jgi:hypothetical protein
MSQQKYRFETAPTIQTTYGETAKLMYKKNSCTYAQENLETHHGDWGDITTSTLGPN